MQRIEDIMKVAIKNGIMDECEAHAIIAAVWYISEHDEAFQSKYGTDTIETIEKLRK